MEPVPGPVCAFCQVDDRFVTSLPEIPVAMFVELEGITVVYPLEIAKRLGLSVTWIGAQITLNENSSLDVVGFLAAITTALAKQGIGVNAFLPISHDHLFVKPRDVELAMATLLAMIMGKSA